MDMDMQRHNHYIKAWTQTAKHYDVHVNAHTDDDWADRNQTANAAVQRSIATIQPYTTCHSPTNWTAWVANDDTTTAKLLTTDVYGRRSEQATPEGSTYACNLRSSGGHGAAWLYTNEHDDHHLTHRQVCGGSWST